MNKQAIVIGLTGPSGSGKSEITKFLFNNQDIFIINADEISHELLKNNNKLKSEIIQHFSNIVLNNKNLIDRKILGTIVFKDKQKLSLLNSIIFPYIKSVIVELINSNKKNYKIILLDAPTLIESNLCTVCNKIIVVTADKFTRLKRIIERDNLSLSEANNRLSAQLSDDEYLKKADFIINNNYSNLSDLKKQTDLILNKIIFQKD